MTRTNARPRDRLERGGRRAAALAVERAQLATDGLSVCPGCRLVLPLHGGPTHAYVGASPACWSLYGELPTAFGLRAVGETARRLALDAYALQHPGRPQMRSVQSVAVHAMGLCVLLERGAEERRVKLVLGRRPTRKAPALHWLEPPRPNGSLTVRDALVADGPEHYATAVWAWAADVWAAWEPHHTTVRRWLDLA
jgi:uncharacterized protein DUF5946